MKVAEDSNPSWGGILGGFFSLYSSDPALRANLHTIAELHLSFGRCSWTACRAESSRCNELSAHRSHPEILCSVPHRASDIAAPFLHRPFRFHVSGTQRTYSTMNIGVMPLTLAPKSDPDFRREFVLTHSKAFRKNVQPAPERYRSERGWDFPTSILQRKICICAHECTACWYNFPKQYRILGYLLWFPYCFSEYWIALKSSSSKRLVFVYMGRFWFLFHKKYLLICQNLRCNKKTGRIAFVSGAVSPHSSLEFTDRTQQTDHRCRRRNRRGW